jgi:hypothetical protein
MQRVNMNKRAVKAEYKERVYVSPAAIYGGIKRKGCPCRLIGTKLGSR